ncbi:MAG: DNA methyltransferase, partial [Gammaproteobacteria bacterium]|nr:DNA methyltransferase [Gammaproteobacteria bacterium]
KFRKLKTRPPHFFFVPKDFSAQAEYENGFAVNSLFQEYNSGIKTGGDDLAVKFSRKEIEAVANDFLSLDAEALKDKYYDRKETGGWGFAAAKQDLMRRQFQVANMLYRPFDMRWTLYATAGFISRPRHKTMRHMLAGDNLGFMTSRSYPTDTVFDSVFITRHIADIHAASGQTYFFPLYLCPDEKQTRLGGETLRKPNLNAGIVKTIADKIGLRFTPEKTTARNAFTPLDILDYIYATLHSPAYRKKFREFLKIDFPRVPYPRDKKQFSALAKLGAELRALHLMESEKLDKPTATYPATGDNIVTAVKFDGGKVWISKTQHFARVPKAAWDFYIGGYQPAQKWLKDRKGRKLSPQDVVHYQKIIAALVATAGVMGEIDKVP